LPASRRFPGWPGAPFLLLLTEVHPRLLDLPPQSYPANAPSLPGPPQMPINEAPLPAATAPAEPPPPPPPAQQG